MKIKLLFAVSCLLSAPAYAMSQPPFESFTVINRCPHPVEIRFSQPSKRPWRMVGREYTEIPTELAADSEFHLYASMRGLFHFHSNRKPRISFYHQNKKIPASKNWQVADRPAFRQQYPRLEGLIGAARVVIACPDNMTAEDKAVL